MKFDTEGTYTLTYTATDSCGNSTSENRTVVVASPRTVLYTDGTFIINEQPKDRASNEALHGAATNTYKAMNTSEPDYVFDNYISRPWQNQYSSITRIEVGTKIKPTNMHNWFYSLPNCISADLTNIDTSECTSISALFGDCTSIETITGTGTWDTKKITDISSAFASCSNLNNIQVENWELMNVNNASGVFENCRLLISLDLSSWKLSKCSTSIMFRGCSSLETVDISTWTYTARFSRVGSMFENCSELHTIYGSDAFQSDKISQSTSMFYGCTKLVGGAGTTYDSSYTDATYARIDNPPDAPGYFTAKE